MQLYWNDPENGILMTAMPGCGAWFLLATEEIQSPQGQRLIHDICRSVRAGWGRWLDGPPRSTRFGMM